VEDALNQYKEGMRDADLDELNQMIDIFNQLPPDRMLPTHEELLNYINNRINTLKLSQ
jgi:hypothetical protein